MPSILDEAASKTAGAAKTIKAVFTGIKGVFMTLMKEHGEVSALMLHVSKTSSATVRQELYPTIRKELLAHERGELAEVYPVLARYPETRQIAADHKAEAGELEAAIVAIDAIDFSSSNWAPAFEHLFDLVKKHVDEEESIYFPKAQKVIGDDAVRTIESRYLAAKKTH